MATTSSPPATQIALSNTLVQQLSPPIQQEVPSSSSPPFQNISSAVAVKNLTVVDMVHNTFCGWICLLQALALIIEFVKHKLDDVHLCSLILSIFLLVMHVCALFAGRNVWTIANSSIASIGTNIGRWLAISLLLIIVQILAVFTLFVWIAIKTSDSDDWYARIWLLLQPQNLPFLALVFSLTVRLVCVSRVMEYKKELNAGQNQLLETGEVDGVVITSLSKGAVLSSGTLQQKNNNPSGRSSVSGIKDFKTV